MIQDFDLMEYTEIIDPIPFPYKEHFSESEFEKIRTGFTPHDMDDKWVIQFENPHLTLYRSWTGQGIYRVELAGNSKGASVVKAVCAKAMLHNSDLEAQSDTVKFLIGNLLLKRNLPFPNPNNLIPEHSKLHQHVISGTGYPEKKAAPAQPWWKRWKFWH